MLADIGLAKPDRKPQGVGMPALGWLVAEDALQLLKCAYPPKYVPVARPHCTLALGGDRDVELPAPCKATVFARVDDPGGVEVLLARIGAATVRPDGAVFHITWSLAAGRKPRDSHLAIRDCPATLSHEPIEVDLVPARF